MNDNNHDQDRIDSYKVDGYNAIKPQPHINESGLLKLLQRFNNLQSDYRNRRSVSLQRLNFRISTVQEQYNAKALQYTTEAEADQAETSVALIHKYKNFEFKEHGISKSSSFSSSIEDSTDHLNTSLPKPSLIASRKRSLPTINHLPSAYPSAMKMSRRQSVTACQGAMKNCDSSKYNTKSSPQSQSVAEADIISIKSRIYNTLNK